ncbi:NADP-dependent oxidoreductase [Leifsonia soli]|uniref:NADPH:quinone reductase-like Zn-dependent oxidoreductase n=1 Tax=Leifsonia soli TaxID=582665 RepID=A0A852T5I5_9MICO|nr:NADP-dependent oxidoreductase [Leifsonia soli]NYD76112.1 NADPH:quinone reductase-like Zn-dependent oxidoreductase [Leifsonia soli]
MKALTASDRESGIAGLALQERPYPHAAENDVIVRVHAAGFTTGELKWPGTWTDRAGHDRTPTIPGHEVAGVVVELGYGTTGLTLGQRVFGIADWTRDGSLAEYVAVETRNLAPLPADIDFVTAASLPISGLTALQGLFVHGNLAPGQTVLVTGAAGGVGSVVCQLAREAGAFVIGAGREQHKARILEAGADRFLNLEDPSGEDDEVDLLFDVLDGPICARLAERIRPGGMLVSIAMPPYVSRADIEVRFFVVETDRQQLTDLITRARSGRLRTFIGDVIPLGQAAAAFAKGSATPGKIVVKVAAD